MVRLSEEVRAGSNCFGSDSIRLLVATLSQRTGTVSLNPFIQRLALLTLGCFFAPSDMVGGGHKSH